MADEVGDCRQHVKGGEGTNGEEDSLGVNLVTCKRLVPTPGRRTSTTADTRSGGGYDAVVKALDSGGRSSRRLSLGL